VNAADDLADVDGVLAGDVDRFAGIVRRWQGPLVTLAYRFCRDRDRAEDLAQVAFLRAFRALRGWRRESTFSSWLFALATNAYRSELRRNPPRIVSLDDLSDMADPRETAQDTGARDGDLRRMVQSLPPKYREALILFYFFEMDVRTVAQTLGVPEGTVKARLFRARALLGEKLSNVPEHGWKATLK
jgi:RNA polymerase sigma-70 factor (ECF subfamily)